MTKTSLNKAKHNLGGFDIYFYKKFKQLLNLD